jgi:hypothetical protein
MSYKAADKRNFDPGPCPSCGGTEIETDWIHIPTQTSVDDAWVPGESRCLDPECGRIFAASQAHNPASRPEAS